MKYILIIEESKFIINLLTIKINEYFNSNIKVLIAHSYKDAVKYINQYTSEIAVAIVDIFLTDVMDGKAIVLTNSNNIPTIVFSDLEDKPHKKLINLENVLDFIPKNAPNSIEYVVSFAYRIIKNRDYTVLIVDDSKVYRVKFKNDLERLFLNVVTAEDGKEAYDIMLSNKYEIIMILTDYNMPKMDGIELVSKLRQTYKKDSLSILAISSNDDIETLTRFIKAGADDYIHKPYVFDELNVRISSNLNTIELFKKANDLANKDFLTGAYNRRYFFEASSAIVTKNNRKQKEIAVATIDIDKFKKINDTYGHDVGDVAIKEVIRVVKSCIRNSDLLARFGGEEFCILLEDISFKDTKKLFEKIRNKFELNNIKIDDNISINYTVSIGVAYKISTNINEMLKISDEALYEAKNTGRNKVLIKQ